jgi:hypothetical protein
LNVDDVEPQQYTKSEEQGMADLDIAARQQFLCGLDNQNISGPVSVAFPKMPRSHKFYRIATKKTQNLYKTWKNRILRAAKLWVGRFIKKEISKDPNFEETSRSFRDLKYAVNQHFRVHHLLRVFKFAKEAVDVTECSERASLFMRCKLDADIGCAQADLKDAFVILAVHSYMTKLHQADPGNDTYAKYTRARLISLFDSIGKKADFRDLSLDDFPLRTTHVSRKRTTEIIDLDEDSDASLGSNFYGGSPVSPSASEDNDNELQYMDKEDASGAENEGQANSRED